MDTWKAIYCDLEGTMSLVNIDHFAKQVADWFTEIQDGQDGIGIEERFRLNLPPSEVEHLVRSAFYASLIPDECRSPSVSLLCYRKESKARFHVLFDQSLAICPEELAKLAHAVSADTHICCVSENQALTISGLHINFLSDQRELGYCCLRTTSPLKVVIRGPGHIEAAVQGMHSLVYKAGKVTEEYSFLESTVVGKLTEVVSKQLQDITKGHVENIEEVFNDIVKGITRLGHGGILLVANPNKASYFSSLRRSDFSLLQVLLARYWTAAAALVAEAGGLGELLNARDRTKFKNLWKVTNAVSMLEKCIPTIAQLAGMDGAIAMNIDCKIGAFNAIIKKGNGNIEACRFVNGSGAGLAYADLIKNKGSRHQAALSYVSDVAESFAFVISQDGLISAFHNEGNGTIICERELRVVE